MINESPLNLHVNVCGAKEEGERKKKKGKKEKKFFLYTTTPCYLQGG